MKKVYNLNVFVKGEKVTLELSTTVENLFDFCSMLHEQLQKDNIPIDAKIHSIVPVEYKLEKVLK